MSIINSGRKNIWIIGQQKEFTSLTNYTRLDMIDLQRRRAASVERNFKERIKVPIFSESVLAIETHVKAPNQLKREKQSQQL